MKRILALFVSAFALFTSYAQTLTNIDPGQDDILFALESLGYKFHKIKLPIDTTCAYNAELIIEEYRDGEIKYTTKLPSRPTFTKMIGKGDTEVSYSSWNEVLVICNPSGPNTLSVKIPNSITLHMPFPIYKEKYSFYSSLPFRDQEFKTEEKIPLVIFGAAWFDERYNTNRFCGPVEEVGGLSPHYYLVSLRLTENHDGIIDLNDEE